MLKRVYAGVYAKNTKKSVYEVCFSYYFFFFLTPSGTFVTVKLECLNAGSASIS